MSVGPDVACGSFEPNRKSVGNGTLVGPGEKIPAESLLWTDRIRILGSTSSCSQPGVLTTDVGAVEKPADVWEEYELP